MANLPLEALLFGLEKLRFRVNLLDQLLLRLLPRGTSDWCPVHGDRLGTEPVERIVQIVEDVPLSIREVAEQVLDLGMPADFDRRLDAVKYGLEPVRQVVER